MKTIVVKPTKRITHSLRSWCPRCRIERTGDSLIQPCACMRRKRIGKVYP